MGRNRHWAGWFHHKFEFSITTKIGIVIICGEDRIMVYFHDRVWERNLKLEVQSMLMKYKPKTYVQQVFHTFEQSLPAFLILSALSDIVTNHTF